MVIAMERVEDPHIGMIRYDYVMLMEFTRTYF